MAHEVADGRMVIFGGGGYNVANVARTWTAAACVLANYQSPKTTPNSWRKMFEALVGEKAPEHMDSDDEANPELSQDLAKGRTGEILQDLKRRIPLLS
jgi:acetoin utilization protein AcuC